MSSSTLKAAIEADIAEVDMILGKNVFSISNCWRDDVSVPKGKSSRTVDFEGQSERVE
jgi:hypothetical protein